MEPRDITCNILFLYNIPIHLAIFHYYIDLTTNSQPNNKFQV